MSRSLIGVTEAKNEVNLLLLAEDKDNLSFPRF